MAEIKGANRYDYEVVKLLRLIDSDDMMLQCLNIGIAAIIPMLKAEDPDFPMEEFVEKIQQKVDLDSMLYQMVPIYNRYYTREEISGLIAFYETPLGSKMIKEMPQIVQETIAANQTWIETVMKDMDAIYNGTDLLSLKIEHNTHENEINKLFDAMGTNFNAIASQMLEAWIKMIQEQNPNFSESDVTSFRNMANENMNIELLRNLFAAIHSRHYSREEIAGLIAFYETPLGRKSTQVAPQITQESQAASQVYIESLSKEIIEELMSEGS